MAARASFTGFESYKLTGVTVTNRELGHGSYATVEELEYMGLKCAGKKVHELLLRQGDTSYTVRRFEEECRLLSQVRHPNIVQFLGVHFQRGVRVPILVMEYLPTNLTSCIEQYGIPPEEISYSILHDVALGLYYLHFQTPPIIHRDLSSNNVLLATNMTAKISDLGVARILNLTPLQVSRMTQTPGTPAYMPPEVMVANPNYNTSVDEFSYGILMIHMFSGRWPEPQIGQVITENGKMTPVSEAERREVFLRAIGNDHFLMDLILRCINNDPKRRAHVEEIVERVSAATVQFPASFSNRLELLRHIAHQEEEKLTLKQEKEAEVQQRDVQISKLTEEAQENAREMSRLKIIRSSEVEQLRNEVKGMKAQNKLLQHESEAEIAELKCKTMLYETQIEKNTETISRERELFKTQLRDIEEQLAKEEEVKGQLLADLKKLQSKLNALQLMVSRLDTDIVTKDSCIQMKDASIKRKDSELDASRRCINEKDVTITSMEQQITGLRQHLSAEKQGLHASITWKECANLPTDTLLTFASAVVIDGKVYIGGGVYVPVKRSSNEDDSEGDNVEDEHLLHTVYCYDPPQDTWSTLPLLPIAFFGLGQINGKLVAVGGASTSDDKASNTVYTYCDNEWKQTIPPMLTARAMQGVFSHGSSLLAMGGVTDEVDDISGVCEIYKSDISQWYTCSAGQLPTPCANMSPVAINNTCYAIGGYKGTSSDPCPTNLALKASIDDLLHHFVSVNTATEQEKYTQSSSWKTLANTPMYSSKAVVINGQLISVGGLSSADLNDEMCSGKVYMYSASSDSWIYISDLPSPKAYHLCVALSSMEILVIGGNTNSVYKGTLDITV